MLASPQTITINAVDKTCNKVSEDLKSSVYANDDGTVEFKVSHQVNKSRTRRMARLDQTVIAADPLTAENAYQKTGVYFVVDEPTFGFSTTEVDNLVQALTGWLTTANVTAMLAGRH